MNTNGTWDLSFLYKSFDDEAIAVDLNTMQSILSEATDKLNAGGEPVSVLESACDSFEKCSGLLSRLSLYCSTTLSVESGHKQAMQLLGRLQLIENDFSLMSSALTRFLGKTDNLDDVIAASPKLQAVSFVLKERRENAAHLIDSVVEPWFLQMHISGASAFAQLRDQLDSSLKIDFNGEQLSLAAIRGKAYSQNADTRRRAYEAELAAYPQIELPMSFCLSSIKREARTGAQAHGYESVLDMTLANSRMDKETLDAMWTAIREYLPHFRRYMRAKGHLLGHENGLPFYDLFAPVGKPGEEWKPEAVREKLMLELGRFTPDMAAFVDHAFENDWIDLYPHPGKQGGAYCASAHSYDRSLVMTNFSGSYSDVTTIAHELGHAWHNRCMAGLPYMLTDVPMQLAETASIFNETILAHSVMQTATDDERFTLLESELSDANQVIVDIYSRYLFETEVVETCMDHIMSADEMKTAMLKAQEASYGDGLDPDIRHPYMWACKPHYYYSELNFYNFPYAFGLLFAKGVFARYLEQGESFVPEYCKLLRSCGSGTIADVAASVGIDVRSVDFWRSSLEVFRKDIDTFCELCEKQL